MSQRELSLDIFNTEKIANVKNCTDKVLHWSNLEEHTLRQRTKLKWLQVGDGNNAYFHATLKAKQSQTAIQSLQTADRRIVSTPEDIESEILGFYAGLIGSSAQGLKGVNLVALRDGSQLTRDQQLSLTVPVSDVEITKALNSINDITAPGLDGFDAKFYKSAWHIVREDVTSAVKEFFDQTSMFYPFNTSLATLIPKTVNANFVKDYRPISCCTIFYKIISKVLTCRLGKVLGQIIDKNQAAFVSGQVIQDHILLAYELLKGYNSKGGVPRCMLQMDIQKAYDTVDWKALEDILRELNFPHQFIRWTMLSVTTVAYSFRVNGHHSRLLKAKRGLRQGYPLSPLLFVIIMEYLNRVMHRLKKIPDFNFHSRCEKLNIINLSFADDLLIFSRGDTKSVALAMDAFEEFSLSTGLMLNPSKCSVYFGSVDTDTRVAIRILTKFQEGTLPFRYLGIPLTNKKLSISHCLILVEKLISRIRHWSSKLLNFASRVQLVKSVLFTTTNYWMQCLPCPKRSYIESRLFVVPSCGVAVITSLGNRR